METGFGFTFCLACFSPARIEMWPTHNTKLRISGVTVLPAGKVATSLNFRLIKRICEILFQEKDYFKILNKDSADAGYNKNFHQIGISLHPSPN